MLNLDLFNFLLGRHIHIKLELGPIAVADKLGIVFEKSRQKVFSPGNSKLLLLSLIYTLTICQIYQQLLFD